MHTSLKRHVNEALTVGMTSTITVLHLLLHVYTTIEPRSGGFSHSVSAANKATPIDRRSSRTNDWRATETNPTTTPLHCPRALSQISCFNARWRPHTRPQEGKHGFPFLEKPRNMVHPHMAPHCTSTNAISWSLRGSSLWAASNTVNVSINGAFTKLNVTHCPIVH